MFQILKVKMVSYDSIIYNMNNIRRVPTKIVIDPREGKGNAQARTARVLLHPVPKIESLRILYLLF